MKKHKTTGQKSDGRRSLHLGKIFNRYSRVQILGAVTLVAGIILVVLLVRGGETSTLDTLEPTASSIVPATENRVDLKNPPEIKGTNRPPVVTAVMLSPNVVVLGVPVRVEVKANDPDQDDVRFDYSWRINGEVVTEQNGEEFDTTGLHKGELLTVSVLPDDGKEQGQPLESNGILIQNRPPEIISMPTAGVSSGQFLYQVIAKDPDNDPLQFSLEGAPPEMAIDPAGLIQWNVPQGLQGKKQIRVIVSDGSASCFQAFNLNLGATTAQ